MTDDPQILAWLDITGAVAKLMIFIFGITGMAVGLRLRTLVESSETRAAGYGRAFSVVKSSFQPGGDKLIRLGIILLMLSLGASLLSFAVFAGIVIAPALS